MDKIFIYSIFVESSFIGGNKEIKTPNNSVKKVELALLSFIELLLFDGFVWLLENS